MFGKPSSAQARGSAIIFVLLIMLIAMLITTTLTTVVISNLRAATAYNENTHAFYAMESGLERSLYYLQYARDQRTIGAQASLDQISSFGGNLSEASYTLAPIFVDDLDINLQEGESAQWDLYQEDYTTSYRLRPMTNLSQAEITWSEAPGCLALTSQVEVSFSAWTEFEWEDITDPSTLVTRYTVTCPGPGVGDPACDGYALGLDDTHLYKIRVKALNCAIEGLRVTPVDSVGSAISTTNYIQLNATGEYGNSSNTGGVVVPWNASLSPYFDYVLFAEDTISK